MDQLARFAEADCCLKPVRTFHDAEVHQELVQKTGSDLDLDFHAFPDLETNLLAQVERIREHPWTKNVPVHRLIYEVESGRLREVA